MCELNIFCLHIIYLCVIFRYYNCIINLAVNIFLKATMVTLTRVFIQFLWIPLKTFFSILLLLDKNKSELRIFES